MPLKRKPQASRAGQPRARKTESTKGSLARGGRPRNPKQDLGSRKKPYRARPASSLSPSQLKVRADALAAHADMLRDPSLTAAQAAKGRGISTREFWVYIPRAFKKDASGRIRAVADRYVRRMEIPGPNGPELIKVRGSKARSEFARYRNDVFRFQGGDLTALDKWDGVTIQGRKLLTDRQILQRQGEQDNLPEHFGSEQVIPYSGGTS
jgi:hypothetical protein